MDSYGKLELSWQSVPLPTHSSQLSYLSRDSLLYNAGVSMNLLDVHTGTAVRFGSETGAVSCLAVYNSKRFVAEAKLSIDPDVTLLDEQGAILGKFETAAQLEYTALAFSSDGKFLAGSSGIPDFKLFLWEVDSYKLMCSTELSLDKRVKEIAFDPLNPARLSLITEEGELYLYKVERCGHLFSKLTRIVIALPDRDCRIGHEQDPVTNQLSRPDVLATLHNPLLADMEFYPYKVDSSLLDTPGKSSAIAQAWTTNSQLYILTSEGIFCVDGEKGKIVILHRFTDSSLIPPHTSQSTSHRDRDTATSHRDRDTATSHSQPRVAFPDHGEEVETADRLVITDTPLANPWCMAVTSEGIVIGYEDGVVRVLDDKNQFVAKGEVRLGAKLECFIFPPDFSTLTAVTETGGLFSIDVTSQREPQTHKLNTINRALSLSIVCLISLSADRELVVTASTEGVMLVWEGRDGQLVSTLHTEEPCTTLVGIKHAPLVVTGTSSGYVCVFDLTEPEQPKLVLTKRIHKERVTQLATDIYSQVIISASTDRSIFVMDSRVSTALDVLCYVPLHSQVSCISVYTQSYKDSLHIALLGSDNDVITFQFNPTWAIGNSTEHYSDPSTKLLNRDISSFVVSKMEATRLSGLCIAGPSLLYSVSRASGELVRIVLAEIETEEGTMQKLFQVEGRYSAHLVPGARDGDVENGCVVVSPTLEWVSSVYGDGRVLMHRVLEPEVGCLECSVAHYSRDSLSAVIFSESVQGVYCVSKWGGGVSCVRLDGSSTMVGRQKAQAALGNKKMRENTLRNTRDKEISHLNTLSGIGELSYKEKGRLIAPYISLSAVPLDRDSDTWLDVCNRVREEKEREAFTSQREELMNGLNELRENVLQMIDKNQGLPEIEQLDRTDFVLDIDRQREMKQRQDETIQAKEKAIHLQNLAKLYLTEQLKDSCWETMTVPGKKVYSFNGKTDVSNYPLSKVSEKERKKRQAALDRLEIVRECIDARDDLEGDIGSTGYKSQVSRVEQKTEDEDDTEAVAASGSSKEEVVDREAIEGRRVEGYGGLLVPSQFSSQSLLSYRDIVLILHQSVYKVKQFFNQEFDEVLKTKQSEVVRINERCNRIRQIIQDLKSKHGIVVTTKSQMLSMHPYEEPDRLLQVIDSEIKIEKYETGAERQQREQLARLEEERILAEMGDRWRERGLDMMMAGKLEIDTEDELFKELVDPEFLDNPALSTDPELQARKQEWELHVAQIREERDKHKRALEAEMTKLEQAIVEGCQRVDDRIQQLYRNKISADKVVYQEEVRIVTLLAAEMFTQELIKQEEFLLKILEQSREYKLVSNERVKEIEESLNACTESYANSQIDDKTIDRNFRKEHSDLEPHLDVLYRLFRKRPRVQKRTVPAVTPTEGALNIFPPRPQSATQGFREAMEELNEFSNAPEGVDREGWERMVQARREKVDSEQRLKRQALDLAEIQAYHQELAREDEHAQAETDATNIELDRLRGVKNRLYFNIQVQLLVKQGQVEIEESGNFLTDHSDSILIFKQTVAELNKQVKLLGREKLERMQQNMDFKRGIHLLEWEHRKLKMQAEDLQKKAKEIQTLKLTKEMQIRMQEAHSAGGNNKADIELLEKTLEYKKRAHESRISTLDSQLTDLNREISKIENNNENLEGDLQEAAVAEAERSQLVDRERPDPQELAKKRVKGVMLRRRMLDMVKAQAREITALRSELERLRLKTFPALLQLD